MTKDKKYQPTPEDLARAEAMMSDEQRQLSEIRSKFWEQRRPAWESFADKIDENFERRRPSNSETVEMNERLHHLADLFRDSKVEWLLDGALNISLLKGDWIGFHKDVDVSVEKDQLEMLEA